MRFLDYEAETLEERCGLCTLKHAIPMVRGYYDYMDKETKLSFIDKPVWCYERREWIPSVHEQLPGTRVAIRTLEPGGMALVESARGYLAWIHKSYLELLPPVPEGTLCQGPFCSGTMPVKRRMQNTAYAVMLLNFVECCDQCFAEIQAHWEEAWADYYSSVL